MTLTLTFLAAVVVNGHPDSCWALGSLTSRDSSACRPSSSGLFTTVAENVISYYYFVKCIHYVTLCSLYCNNKNVFHCIG